MNNVGVAKLVTATAMAGGLERHRRSPGRACGRSGQQRGTHNLQVRVLPPAHHSSLYVSSGAK